MGCSIQGDGKEGEVILDGKPCGLIYNHAYGLNDIIEFKDPFDKGGKSIIKLLRIRNPWGNKEWNGAWSAKSKEETKYKNSI